MSDHDDEFEYIRTELEALSKDELIQEVISRIQDQQKMLIDNWHDNKEIRRQNAEYRKSIATGLEAMERFNALTEVLLVKIQYWKNSFWILIFLIMLTLIFSYLK